MAVPPYRHRRSRRTTPRRSAPDALVAGYKRPRPLQVRDLLIFGVDFENNPFREPIRGEIEKAKQALRGEGRVLFNAQSNPDFGWSDHESYTGWELNGQWVEVVGAFNLQRSFGADATVICDPRNFARVYRTSENGPINLGLLTIRTGSSADETVRKLNAILPADVMAKSRAELLAIEGHYWVVQTPWEDFRLRRPGDNGSGGRGRSGPFNDVRIISRNTRQKRWGIPTGISRVVLTGGDLRDGRVLPAVGVGYVLYRVTDALEHSHNHDCEQPGPGAVPESRVSSGFGAVHATKSPNRRSGRPLLNRGIRPMSMKRRVPLAWRNLTENKWRLLASAAGTAFAVVLMLLQNGFRDALLDNMSSLITNMDGDLFVISRVRYILSHPAPFPRGRLSHLTSKGRQPARYTSTPSKRRKPLNSISRRIRVVAYPPMTTSSISRRPRAASSAGHARFRPRRRSL